MTEIIYKRGKKPPCTTLPPITSGNTLKASLAEALQSKIVVNSKLGVVKRVRGKRP